MAYRRSKRDFGMGGLVGKVIKGLVAVLVLTAFVLGITFSVKQIALFNSEKLAQITSSYLVKLGFGEETIGEVAGVLMERAADLGAAGQGSSNGAAEETNAPNSNSATHTNTRGHISSEKIPPEGELLFSVAILADSHIANDKQEYINNKEHLRLAVEKAKGLKAEAIVHVGDITNLGVLGDLQEAKGILDDSNINYYTLPGDRDLFQSVGTENFLRVFDKDRFVFEKDGQKFVGLNNSANYTPISQENMDWFKGEIKDADFVLLSQPLYSDGFLIFNYLYMGSSGEEPANDSYAQKEAAVKAQRDDLLEAIRASGVKAVIAGDHHRSDFAVDPVRPSLEHYVIGAVSETVGEYAQSVLQPQKFGILKVYENGGYEIEDVFL